MDEQYYQRRHEMIALPTVRIRTEKSGGSGTVVYSNDGSTYVLTNHHVVDNAIKIEKKWSTLLKSERKMDVFNTVNVHFFNYAYRSRNVGANSIQSDVMAYDPEEDLALLRLRGEFEAHRVAKLYTDDENELRVGMPVITAGAGLGEPPVQTEGILSQFGIDLERREYWLTTAPSIFGNSGGSCFLADENRFELIGVPARIAVSILGWSASAVTHLSYVIPITRVYDFLENQRFRFIYDQSFTELGEEEERKKLREREEEKMAMASLEAPTSGVLEPYVAE